MKAGNGSLKSAGVGVRIYRVVWDLGASGFDLTLGLGFRV